MSERDALPLAGPSASHAWRETRALLDAARMTLPLLLPAGPARARRPRQIIVLPGFGADDRATWPLRRYLAKLGHHVEGWGLGLNRAGIDIRHTLADLSPGWAVEPIATYRNEASVPMLCDRMVERVRRRHGELGGGPLTLVGWSLGGVVAREVARDLPDLVEEVITLGTPVQGGPKYTRAAAFFRGRGMDLDWIERGVARRESRPIRAPITAITSPTDAVVGHAATRDHHSPDVRHIDVDAAHLGLVFNPTVWRMIAETLNRRD
ncbi:thioesterase domain-containing protein [Arenimonas sp. MALMAid1274]|uniref:thioesterase domain-containing protein n=1 Tax=Arenimonas sp. MALMAid1274 TaxID=3411630 RepID=UPI003BA16896